MPGSAATSISWWRGSASSRIPSAVHRRTVQDAELLQVAGVSSQLADDLYEETLFHTALHTAELVLWGDEDEVVSMHYAAVVSSGEASHLAGASRVP